MTLAQITLLRSQHQGEGPDQKPNADSTVIVFDDGMSFESGLNMIVWDDGEGLLHEISVADPRLGASGAAKTPYKITTGTYDNIHFMEGLYNLKNFKQAVEDMFVDTNLITTAQHNILIKWAENIRNHDLQPIRPTPYFTQDADVVPMEPNVLDLKRDDGIVRISTPNTELTNT